MTTNEDIRSLDLMSARLRAISRTGGRKIDGTPGPGNCRVEVLVNGTIDDLRALDAEAAELAIQIEWLEFQLFNPQ